MDERPDPLAPPEGYGQHHDGTPEQAGEGPEGDPVAQALTEWMPHGTHWTGTAGELLAALGPAGVSRQASAAAPRTAG